ncbi:MAG: hypothetical protein RL418_240, partial [Actinomycetota bacterium]
CELHFELCIKKRYLSNLLEVVLDGIRCGSRNGQVLNRNVIFIVT